MWQLLQGECPSRGNLISEHCDFANPRWQLCTWVHRDLGPWFRNSPDTVCRPALLSCYYIIGIVLFVFIVSVAQQSLTILPSPVLNTLYITRYHQSPPYQYLRVLSITRYIININHLSSASTISASINHQIIIQPTRFLWPGGGWIWHYFDSCDTMKRIRHKGRINLVNDIRRHKTPDPCHLPSCVSAPQ